MTPMPRDSNGRPLGIGDYVCSVRAEDRIMRKGRIIEIVDSKVIRVRLQGKQSTILKTASMNWKRYIWGV